jgi:hypothetical protein
MAAFIDTTVKQIDDRLSELVEDISRLEAARAALLGTGPSSVDAPRRRRGRPRKAAAPASSAKPATKPPAAGRKPGRPRGARGGNTRATEALALVQKQPGITIPALAAAMKIQPNYLYRVLPGLVEAGQVKRVGKGWHPAS